MTKNTLGDLNGYLFEQLERLNNDGLKGEAMQEEIARGKAIEGVAKSIISNARVLLDAKKLKDDRMDANLELPKMIEG